MELQMLEYFRVLGRVQHVTRAAEQLGISQPALSRAIARLERELGVPLFHPVGRSIALSSYGEVFLAHVERALDELANGRGRIDEMSGAEGTIALGFLRSLAVRFVPDLVQRFGATHAGVRFVFTEDNRERLLEHLETGRIALCLTVRVESERFAWEPIAEQELIAIVPRSHRFAARDRVALAELAGERFVSFKRGYPIRIQIEQLCEAAGFTPNIVSESDESASVRGLVAAGAGVAIVPRSGANDDVATLTITDPGATREIGIAWVAGRYLSEAERAFRRFVTTPAEFTTRN
ncbi:MAG TPA: LysR family transcriptional regulator [Candidatus Acidoferrum sp.]|nr:LysR family transcriptional regulator [Candidatus Acidoferrum sp.]